MHRGKNETSRLVRGLVFRKHGLTITASQAHAIIDLVKAGCIESTSSELFKEMVENIIAADVADENLAALQSGEKGELPSRPGDGER